MNTMSAFCFVIIYYGFEHCKDYRVLQQRVLQNQEWTKVPVVVVGVDVVGFLFFLKVELSAHSLLTRAKQ